MKKTVFFGFMASMLIATGAALADSAALTTQGYVNAGLKAVYKAVDDVKADKTTVDTLNDTVSTLSGVITDANSGLATRAAQADLTELANAVNNETTGLASKASAASVNTLTQTVNNKADSTTVTALQQQVNNLSSSVDGISYTGQAGIAVDNDTNTIGLQIEDYDASKVYVYKNGAWTALDVNATFPDNYNFAGE